MTARLHVPSLVGATIVGLTLAVYVVVMQSQGDTPAAWFAGGLVFALAAAAHAAVCAGNAATVLCLLAGATMMALGLLAILSIGWPLLVAGLAMVVTCGRRRTACPHSSAS